MNNEGWSLNSLLAGLGVLTFALVFAVVLYDAKIKEIGERTGTIETEKKEKEDTYTYIDMEKDLVEASESYIKEEYGKHVPEGSMRISIDTLVEEGFLEKPYNPKNKSEICTGYVIVEVEKNHTDYSPYLKCGKNYESKDR